MSDTPRVDAIITGNSDVTNEEYEDLAYLARALERENAAMREAIREADGALRKCLNYMLRLPLSGSDAECEAMDDAHHALSKLQLPQLETL